MDIHMYVYGYVYTEIESTAWWGGQSEEDMHTALRGSEALLAPQLWLATSLAACDETRAAAVTVSNAGHPCSGNACAVLVLGRKVLVSPRRRHSVQVVDPAT